MVTKFLSVCLELTGRHRHRPPPARRSQPSRRPRSRRRSWPCRTRTRVEHWRFSWIRRLRSRTFRALHLDPWGLAWSSTSRGFLLRLAAVARSSQGMRSRVHWAGLPPRCRPARGQSRGPWPSKRQNNTQPPFRRVPPGCNANSRLRGYSSTMCWTSCFPTTSSCSRSIVSCSTEHPRTRIFKPLNTKRISLTRDIALFSLALYSMRRGYDLSFTLGFQILKLSKSRGLSATFSLVRRLGPLARRW